MAVVGEILRDEIHLDRSLRFEPPGLLHQPPEPEGAVTTAPQGDGAERAPVVAALADLQVAHVAGSERKPVAGMRGARPLRQQSALDQLGHEPVEIAQAQEQIHFGEGGLEFVPVALDHAPDGDDRAAPSLALEPPRLEQGLDRLLLGGVDEAAGIHQDDVGVRQIRHASRTASHERGEHPFGVDRVLVAPEAHEPQSGRAGRDRISVRRHRHRGAE